MIEVGRQNGRFSYPHMSALQRDACRHENDRRIELLWSGEVQTWKVAVTAKNAYIEPGSPRENGYYENFDTRLRGELSNGEVI